jgi:hypothetical protein
LGALAHLIIEITIEIDVPFAEIAIIIGIHAMRPMGLAFRKQIYAHAFRQFAILPHIGSSPAVGVVVTYYIGCLIAHTQRLLLGNLIVEARIQENISTIGIRGSALSRFSCRFGSFYGRILPRF